MQTRLPIQVGTSSLWSVARAAASLVPGLVLSGAGAMALFGNAAKWLVVAGPLGVYLVVYAGLHMAAALRTRASDAVLDAEGLSIEGGVHHTLRLRWADIDPAGSQVVSGKEKRLTISKIIADGVFLVLSTLLTNSPEAAPAERVLIRRLRLAARDGRSWEIAEAEHPAEQASLDALFGSIHGKTAPRAATPPAAPPGVHGCPACGAPVTPVDADVAQCSFCGTPGPVPPGIRQRLQAQQAVSKDRHRASSAVQELLRQPGARRANFMLVSAAALSLFVWLIILGVMAFTGLTSLGIFEVGWLLASGMLFALVTFVLGRFALIRRRALHLLASGYGARPLAGSGGAFGCRLCAGPLPVSQTIVVRCVYCEADNLLGLDIGAESRASSAHRESIEQLLAQRRRAALGWLLGAGATVVPLGLASVMALASIAFAHEVASSRADCDAGKAAACHALARSYDLGIGVAEDDSKAFDLDFRACDLGDREACYETSKRLRWGWGAVENPAEAARYRGRACAMGLPEACADED